MWSPRLAKHEPPLDQVSSTTSAQSTERHAANGLQAPYRERLAKWLSRPLTTAACGQIVPSQYGVAVCLCLRAMGDQLPRNGQKSRKIFYAKWVFRRTLDGLLSITGTSSMTISTSRCYAPSLMVLYGIKSNQPEEPSRPARSWSSYMTLVPTPEPQQQKTAQHGQKLKFQTEIIEMDNQS